MIQVGNSELFIEPGFILVTPHQGNENQLSNARRALNTQGLSGISGSLTYPACYPASQMLTWQGATRHTHKGKFRRCMCAEQITQKTSSASASNGAASSPCGNMLCLLNLCGLKVCVYTCVRVYVRMCMHRCAYDLVLRCRVLDSVFGVAECLGHLGNEAVIWGERATWPFPLR